MEERARKVPTEPTRRGAQSKLSKSSKSSLLEPDEPSVEIEALAEAFSGIRYSIARPTEM